MEVVDHDLMFDFVDHGRAAGGRSDRCSGGAKVPWCPHRTHPWGTLVRGWLLAHGSRFRGLRSLSLFARLQVILEAHLVWFFGITGIEKGIIISSKGLCRIRILKAEQQASVELSKRGTIQKANDWYKEWSQGIHV